MITTVCDAPAKPVDPTSLAPLSGITATSAAELDDAGARAHGLAGVHQFTELEHLA